MKPVWVMEQFGYSMIINMSILVCRDYYSIQNYTGNAGGEVQGFMGC